MEMTQGDERLIRQFEVGMKAVGTRWKPAILFCLIFGGTLRFSQLQKLIPEVTHKMLTQRLRELERDGLVARIFHEEIPPRVEYQLTELGRSVVPCLRAFCTWAEEHSAAVASARLDFDSRLPASAHAP